MRRQSITKGASYSSTRDGSPDQHFQAEDVSLASIADALSQWMRGDRTFIDDHEWKPLSI
jgi:hypothetical protein